MPIQAQPIVPVTSLARCLLSVSVFAVHWERFSENDDDDDDGNDKQIRKVYYAAVIVIALRIAHSRVRLSVRLSVLRWRLTLYVSNER